MCSLSTPSMINCSAVAYRRILPSPENIHLPECFIGGTTSVNHIKNQSLNYQFNHKKVATRVSKDEHQHVSIAHQGHDAENDIEGCIEYIRRLLKTTGDGRISVSAYDTAWVALIEDLEGGDAPQFPSCLEWIKHNQLHDGSWGDQHFFCVYDRLLNTIACVVALRSWNVDAPRVKKGALFIKQNVQRLKDGNIVHMPCGFELVFPALLERAKNLGIQDLPYDHPIMMEIYFARQQKLKRIPMEMMHKVPTSLLFSLEGLENLEWEKLLKFRSGDGSFLTSPSSTAFAFMQTVDDKCFNFLKFVVLTFNGAAPNTYPVDLFARLWAVDRLQRLGISRFFDAEIDEALNHVFRFWSDRGVFCARETPHADMDDTTMGFRLLRMHGYDMDSTDVLRNFKHEGKFCCQAGQMIESSSPIYNLYRASQLQFPGEEILEEAHKFAFDFLQEELRSNGQIVDKWIISKHLSDEIRLGLEMPWYATLPRVEARYYIQHYAGSDEVWIGKNLFRMPEISNDTYLNLAKMDFKRCQEQHIFEWNYMQEWYDNCNIAEFGINRKYLLLAYFLATASIFEIERMRERIAWAKTEIISNMIASFFNNEATSFEEKRALSVGFKYKTDRTAEKEHGDADTVLATLHQFLEGFDEHTSPQLKNIWGIWWTKLQQGETNHGADAELLTNTLNICAGDRIAFKEEILYHDEYKALSNLTNIIWQQLTQIETEKDLEMEGETTGKSGMKRKEVEKDMQELVKLVLLKESLGINRKIKQTFLLVAKTYYYRAYNAAETIDAHMFKVLFEPVV